MVLSGVGGNVSNKGRYDSLKSSTMIAVLITPHVKPRTREGEGGWRRAGGDGYAERRSYLRIYSSSSKHVPAMYGLPRPIVVFWPGPKLGFGFVVSGTVCTKAQKLDVM